MPTPQTPREFDLMLRTLKLIDDVLDEHRRAKILVDDAYDEETCQRCHDEARDRDDSPWCLNCRIVEQEYDHERKGDR